MNFLFFYIDLDDFKKVNDLLGHDYGDRLLTAVSNRMQSLLIDNALNAFILARIGGDEFAIIFTPNEKDIHKASASLAELLCNKVSEPYLIDNQKMIIGCSMGVAVFPEHARSTSRIMRCADLAMYHAKENGKNSYAFFTEALTLKLEQQLNLELEIETGLANQDFKLFFQKQYHLKDLTVSGMEVLLRWQKNKKMVSPSEFIPFAEQNKLIDKIDNYVLNQSCAQIQQWKQNNLAPPRLAINISSQQFNCPNFFKDMDQSLKRYDLSGNCIELEINEYSLVENIEQYSANQSDGLKKLEELGVQLSIDDFGTGYSSLAYLKHLNIDRLKIDQSFIRDMTTNADSLTIVQSIINLAHSLGTKVLAEGIETEEQLRLLQSLECDEGQGFFLHKPESSDAITHQLTAT